MTAENPADSLFEALEQDPKERAALAAASLANSVGSLMERMAENCQRLSLDIARDMGVTGGRVSQLVHGDGNVRIASLARLADACGYELSITATSRSAGVPAITVPTVSRGRRPGGTRTPVLVAVSSTETPDAFYGREAHTA